MKKLTIKEAYEQADEIYGSFGAGVWEHLKREQCFHEDGKPGWPIYKFIVDGTEYVTIDSGLYEALNK